LKKYYRSAFTSDIRHVASARSGIAAFAGTCGFPDDTVADIRLAAGEALSNAVEHGCASQPRLIAIHCSWDGAALSIEISDSGPGFPAPLERSSVEPDDRGRGFGIFLMRRLMDEVSFSRNGTVVRLVRRRL
jgi:serine/threonine-protein kinase RsbW